MALFNELPTLMNSAKYNTGIFHNVNYCDRSNLYNDRPTIHDNYGYQRGTVDNSGFIRDYAGNYTGDRYEKHSVLNNYNSRTAIETNFGRLQNNLGEDLGMTVRHHEYDIKPLVELPTLKCKYPEYPLFKEIEPDYLGYKKDKAYHLPILETWKPKPIEIEPVRLISEKKSYLSNYYTDL